MSDNRVWWNLFSPCDSGRLLTDMEGHGGNPTGTGITKTIVWDEKWWLVLKEQKPAAHSFGIKW